MTFKNSMNVWPTERKRMPTKLEVAESDGTFSGYASLFGKVDLGKDRVEKGAFSKSIAQRGKSAIRMLFQHDPSDPIGVWEIIKEDQRGLFVKGKISLDSARGAEVMSLIRSGAVDGLSIGFKTVRSRTDRKTGIRSILEADLWEISIVTFPMLPQARVSDVKANAINLTSRSGLPSLRDFERWLTQDAGLSRGEARTVIRKGFAHLIGKQDAASSSQSGSFEKRMRLRLRHAAQKIQQETT